VILLFARAGEESRIEEMQAGADDYLVKPFSGKELLARIQAHLRLAALRGESQVALRESEALHRVLSDLAAATQPLTEPVDTMAESARILAEHLKVERCAYFGLGRWWLQNGAGRRQIGGPAGLPANTPITPQGSDGDGFTLARRTHVFLRSPQNLHKTDW
jgi:CheY-like chemotaxis protein